MVPSIRPSTRADAGRDATYRGDTPKVVERNLKWYKDERMVKL
jgi:hypothetical protein